jgi:dodecin
MANPVYKKIQFVGTSPNSFSDAVANAVAKAAQNEKNLSWFEVTEHRGAVTDGKIQQFQVTISAGVKLD